MTRVLVGSTLPAFKMTDQGHWWHWLQNAREITLLCAGEGVQVDWCAVLQHDARGLEPFGPLARLLSELDPSAVNVSTRSFSVDLGGEQWTTETRLTPICIGRNLISDQAIRHGHEWVYFADSDISAPDDVLLRLLELDYPVCAAHIPMYGLDGPPATESLAGAAQRAGRKGDVRVHWNPAGSLLMHRDAFRRVPWRYDPDNADSDDPATQKELAALGWPTLVRHDITCQHHPAVIGPVETRGHDLTVYR